jgi:protocatechuate 3,4-dioxygenase beta subunit
MKTRSLWPALLLPTVLAAQARPDLHECEGCEAICEHPFDDLSWRAVIPPPDEPGEPLILSGRVYRPDGKTPAADVVIYIHHTNAEGIYPVRGTESGWGRRHGYLRGWVKTGQAGDFRFETIRPAAYPGRTDPAHIHMTVKEPGRREYWIDDVVFTDDPRVTAQYRARVEGRGGSGIVTPTRDASGSWIVRRDVILEP